MGLWKHSLVLQCFGKYYSFCRAVVSGNGRFLTVDEADVEDAGKYKCTAHNNAGHAQKDFDVDVRGS